MAEGNCNGFFGQYLTVIVCAITIKHYVHCYFNVIWWQWERFVTCILSNFLLLKLDSPCKYRKSTDRNCFSSLTKQCAACLWVQQGNLRTREIGWPVQDVPGRVIGEPLPPTYTPFFLFDPLWFSSLFLDQQTPSQ
jgi:hypothetical protein